VSAGAAPRDAARRRVLGRLAAAPGWRGGALGPALAYHLGAFGGQWLGMRAARLPDGLMGRLSLHERLRAGS
jgi:hypothetical protein